MTITLKKITKDNYRPIAKLSNTLTPQQQKWVAPNAISILDAFYYPHLEVRGVYADDIPVGLVMWGYEVDEKRWWIVRMMIAQPEQGKGYGRAAMQQVIDLVRASQGDTLYISFVPDNDPARILYESLGFVSANEVIEGETVYRLTL